MIKGFDFLYLRHLQLEDIVNFFLTNKQIYKDCDKESLWNELFKRDFNGYIQSYNGIKEEDKQLYILTYQHIKYGFASKISIYPEPLTLSISYLNTQIIETKERQIKNAYLEYNYWKNKNFLYVLSVAINLKRYDLLNLFIKEIKEANEDIKLKLNDDIKIRLSETFYLNGKIKSRTTDYRDIHGWNDIKVGYQKYFHNNGKLNILEIYDEDGNKLLEKEWEEDGTLIKVERYDKGRKHGWSENFYVNGSPFIRTLYEKGEVVTTQKFPPKSF